MQINIFLRTAALASYVALFTAVAAPEMALAKSPTQGRSSTAQPADLILINAVVLTLDPAQRLAQTVAVSRGQIVYVGDADGSHLWRGPKTHVIDLHGKAVLPGLADAHIHAALGEFLNYRLCNVRALTLEEGFAQVRRCAAAAPPGDWVVGYGWYDLDNPEYDKVTRAQLDSLVSNRKLVIISKDLHTVWANSKTLKEFGIDRATASPRRGRNRTRSRQWRSHRRADRRGKSPRLARRPA